MPVLIPSIISAAVTIASITVLYKGIVSNENEKRLQNLTISNENILKNNKLVLETYLLTKQKDELKSAIAIDIERQKKITDSIAILSKEIILKNKENDQLKNQVSQMPEVLSKQRLLKYLEDVDMQLNFFYSRNPKAYSKLGEAIRDASETNYEEIINSYISSESNSFANRAYVIMAAYNYANHKTSPLLKLFHEILSPQICLNERSPELTKIVSCNEWADDTYHLTVRHIINYGKNSSCPLYAYDLINLLLLARNDLKLLPQGNVEDFLSYLSLYKSIILKDDYEIQITTINRMINLKNVPLSIIKTYLSFKFSQNKSSFNSFISGENEIVNEKRKSRIKNFSNRLEISESDFSSLEFWEKYKEDHKLLIARLLEDNFNTYKNNKDQLLSDMQE